MQFFPSFSAYKFVLASQSPRRQEIFKSLGLNYVIRTKDVEEDFSAQLVGAEIPMYLAQKKADAQRYDLIENEILVTADTVVWINEHVLNKPLSLTEAKAMLEELSGKQHTVITAVCLTTADRQFVFAEETHVEFHPLKSSEIDYYLNLYHPLDKAGAYGIQEFIGYVGIKSIQGDFYNVVGFPVQRFWRELGIWIEEGESGKTNAKPLFR